MDNDDDILQEIRMKYAEDLEEILECPVCYELPKGIIAMCNEGHHICSNCMSLLNEKCPTCQSSYGSCRNYVAEMLCNKFEDIKNSILNPHHASNRRVIKNKVSVEVQTELTYTNCSLENQSSNFSINMKVDGSQEDCSLPNSQPINSSTSTNMNKSPLFQTLRRSRKKMKKSTNGTNSPDY